MIAPNQGAPKASRLVTVAVCGPRKVSKCYSGGHRRPWLSALKTSSRAGTSKLTPDPCRTFDGYSALREMRRRLIGGSGRADGERGSATAAVGGDGWKRQSVALGMMSVTPSRQGHPGQGARARGSGDLALPIRASCHLLFPVPEQQMQIDSSLNMNCTRPLGSSTSTSANSRGCPLMIHAHSQGKARLPATPAPAHKPPSFHRQRASPTALPVHFRRW